MTRRANKLIPGGFPALPGIAALDSAATAIGSDPVTDVDAVGLIVFSNEELSETVPLSRDALERAGFTATAGATLVLPQRDEPELVLVGLGERSEVTAATVRDAAAAFARATSRLGRLHLALPELDGMTATDAASAAYEGIHLARYRYTPLKAELRETPLLSVTITEPRLASGPAGTDPLAAAAARTRATVIARDLANTPPGHLTATDMGDIAVDLGSRFGFDVELFDRAALLELGCGGLLGVNQGSAEEPRMIRLRYTPDGTPTGHLALIGKGIMYDSGGISLKPSDPMHLLMKMDMGGAAAVLGAFTGLREFGVSAQVTGWLMCTDNMPSGSSYKLGDVLTARGGTTIEVKNTDAEGRLVMADAFVLANEAGVDAIIDIATLTGAALMAFGTARAPLFSNDDELANTVLEAALTTDEPLWRMPLERKYRKQLDSDIADISNLGGPHAGATTAALFLEHFAGTTPWAHIDIAGTMQAEADDAWRSKGATGFGARLLLEAAARYPGASR